MRRNIERTVRLTREQAQRFFEEHKIRYVLAQFVDIHGAAKAKGVPVEHLDMVLTDGAGFAGFALWGFGMGPGHYHAAQRITGKGNWYLGWIRRIESACPFAESTPWRRSARIPASQGRMRGSLR
jgi:hypothetical protein